MIQTKKIKNLTDEDLNKICNQDCDNCPLAIIITTEIICLKREMNKKISFEVEYKGTWNILLNDDIEEMRKKMEITKKGEIK